jgi:hypothetical protein
MSMTMTQNPIQDAFAQRGVDMQLYTVEEVDLGSSVKRLFEKGAEWV